MWRSIGILFCMCLGIAPLALGCSCWGERQPCEFLSADAVFVGTVIELQAVKRPVPPESLPSDLRGQEVWTDGYSMRFSVEERLSGEIGAELNIETGSWSGDCGMPIPPGGRFLIFAHRDGQGNLWTTICSGNVPLTGGAKDVTILGPYRALLKDGRGSIVGKVTRHQSAWRKGHVEDATSQPVSSLLVRALGDGPSAVAKTGADGSYKFHGLPPGHYFIVPQMDSQFELENPTADRSGHVADIRAGACVNLSFNFYPKSRIKGHVILPREMEGKKVEVIALPATWEEIEPFAGKSAVTDADGRFDLWPLPPGHYYVGVNIGNNPFAATPFPPTYYPGVLARQSAAVVHVAADEAIELELPLPEVAEPRSVNFVAIGSDGKPLQKLQIQIEDRLHPGDPGTFFQADLDRTGGGSLRIYSGHAYHLHGSYTSADGHRWCSVPVVIPSGNQSVNSRLVMEHQGAGCDITSLDQSVK